MSKSPDNNDGFNDADLKAMFADHKTEPAAELDKLILANAKLDHQDTNSQGHKTSQRHKTFVQKYAPLFGTAAVLMIGIAVVPLIMQAPESSLDHAYAPSAEPSAMPAAQSTVTGFSGSEAKNQSPDRAAPSAPMSVDSATSAIAADADLATVSEQAVKPLRSQSIAPEPIVIREALKKQIARDTPIQLSENESSETDTEFAKVVDNPRSDKESLADANDDTLGTVSMKEDAETEKNEEQDSSPESTVSPLASSAVTSDSQPRIGAAPNDALKTRREERSTPTTLVEQKRQTKYRSTAVLWINEIKRLFEDEKLELAEEELMLFRAAYPENSNERLLPDSLQD